MSLSSFMVQKNLLNTNYKFLIQTKIIFNPYSSSENMTLSKKYIFLLFISMIYFSSCSEDKSKLFTKLSEKNTGIDFRNMLMETNADFNIMQYAYFYNGGGVAVCDINNDSLPDIIFTGNMVKNRLYLNKGNFHFEDITVQSGIAAKEGWCTGATATDVNGDGWQDIYICRSGLSNTSYRRNLLFINNHNNTFTEEAAAYGIDDAGYSTQASFFDYDKDGDLDLMVINQSTPQYSKGGLEYAQLHNQQGDSVYENHLYRNDGNHFTNVTQSAGISSNVLSFSLGISTADIDMDGWPDIYISNDFNEPDYLFINNHDGTFTDKLKQKLDHCSLYSMGCDVADFDNDALPDICVPDMLPENNHDIKMHIGADNFDKFQYLFSNGYYYQYMKNSLQKNNGDGTFSEIGQYAGVSNTDWSWSPLFADFDNDGNKDLFITNGYKRDNTNLQFIKYTMDEAKRTQQDGKPTSVEDYISKMQGISINNYMFHNEGDDHFNNMTESWGLAGKSFSHGAAYADLDNDGDLDLIINNTDDFAGIYQNNSESVLKNNFLRIQLKGDKNNATGIGAKILVYKNKNLIYQEQLLVRGYQSSVDDIMNIGLGNTDEIDSLRIIWPGDQTELREHIKANQTLHLKIDDAKEVYDYKTKTVETIFNEDKNVLSYVHHENMVNDFTRQFLLPHFYSHNGPCMTKADINGDGLDDLFIGGSKGNPGAVFTQTKDHSFNKLSEPEIAKDSLSEDAAAVFFDANGDGKNDLYVASGGYDDYAKDDPLLQDRLYINDGKGNFIKAQNALPANHGSKGCVCAYDIDGDGDIDLFVGGKVVPGQWPQSCASSILINNGKGVFTDETAAWNKGLANAGIVTDAVWVDINKDNIKDLIIAGEWIAPTVFINNHKTLTAATFNNELALYKGWWNTITAGDFDKDGDIDFVAGNYGLNSQLHATEKEPVQLFNTDIDGNGSDDPILTSYISAVQYPFNTMDDINGQVPLLRKKFYAYPSFADATIKDIISEDQMKKAKVLSANNFQTIYFENTGKGFIAKELPYEAQLAPVYTITAKDINNDGFDDLILFGNNIYNRIRLGRDDANHGTVLLNDGKGSFSYLPSYKTGITVKGDVCSCVFVNDDLLIGINNDSLRTYKLKK